MSLSGRQILITRPSGQCAPLAALLQQQQARAHPFPLMSIEPDPQALAALPAAYSQADWVIFVSPSAVDCAWPWLSQLQHQPQFATIGPASAQKLSRLSKRQVLYPHSGQDSTALLAEPALANVQARRFLIIRGRNGRNELGDALLARQAQVSYAEIYQREDATPDWVTFDRLAARQKIDGCIITSNENVERLFRLAGSLRTRALQCMLYCVPHPRIAQSLAAKGVARIVTTQASDAALVAGLKEWFSRHP